MVGDSLFLHGKSRYWLRIVISGLLLGCGCVFLWPRSTHATIAKRAIQEDFESFKAGSNITLIAYDSYSCGPGKPCSNGACCGSSGYCGYGPIYCGNGCVSNCDAVAECGQYAKIAGQTCPLNTCCSHYGFVSQDHLPTDIYTAYIRNINPYFVSVARRKSSAVKDARATVSYILHPQEGALLWESSRIRSLGIMNHGVHQKPVTK